jgi:hypothetical protein
VQQLPGRPSAENPAVVGESYELSFGELGEGDGHRRAARGNKVCEHCVSETQPKDDPVGANLPPAAGEVPEEHVQADVGARLMNDRHARARDPRGVQ